MDAREVRRIIRQIEVADRDVTFIVGRFSIEGVGFHSYDPGPLYLQVQDTVTDRDTGETAKVRGRKWALSSHMTESEVVQTAFLALKQFDEHELREAFTYRGQLVFNPHLNLSNVAHLMEDGLVPESRRT